MGAKLQVGDIEKLARADQYEDAIQACEDLLKDENVSKWDVLRVRAYVYARSGEHASAVADLEEVLRSDSATLKDRYQAADQSLKAGDLSLATKRFHEVLELGKEQREGWFKASALFYLAFLYLETNQLESAMRHAEAARKLEPDCAMPLTDGRMVSIDELELRIAARMRSDSKSGNGAH